MIVPCENIQELSPSLKGVGCCPRDFSLKTQRPVCLSYYVYTLPECMCSAVCRLIRFSACTSLGDCEIDLG